MKYGSDTTTQKTIKLIRLNNINLDDDFEYTNNIHESMNNYTPNFTESNINYTNNTLLPEVNEGNSVNNSINNITKYKKSSANNYKIIVKHTRKKYNNDKYNDDSKTHRC
jgi:hypothetical protein